MTVNIGDILLKLQDVSPLISSLRFFLTHHSILLRNYPTSSLTQALSLSSLGYVPRIHVLTDVRWDQFVYLWKVSPHFSWLWCQEFRFARRKSENSPFSRQMSWMFSSTSLSDRENFMLEGVYAWWIWDVIIITRHASSLYWFSKQRFFLWLMFPWSHFINPSFFHLPLLMHDIMGLGCQLDNGIEAPSRRSNGVNTCLCLSRDFYFFHIIPILIRVWTRYTALWGKYVITLSSDTWGAFDEVGYSLTDSVR